MDEIFKNVRQEVKEMAEISWKIALAQPSPAAAATFLDNVTNFYETYYTEEEVDFLRFYFHMQMEMMKQ